MKAEIKNTIINNCKNGMLVLTIDSNVDNMTKEDLVDIIKCLNCKATERLSEEDRIAFDEELSNDLEDYLN